MVSRSISVRNGSVLVKEYYFTCDRCGSEMHESDPRHREDEKDFCPECAYLLDLISDAEYKRSLYYLPDHIQVAKHEGVVYRWFGKKKPWERKDKDYRASQQYKEWRMAVFSRDSFTCQKCGATRPIEAHHINTFNKHPALRFEVSNGITLCRSCHIEEHRGRKNVH